MRSSSFIFVAGLLFILLTDTILWYQLRQYFRKKWQVAVYILHSILFLVALVIFQTSVTHLKGPQAYFWIGKFIGILFLFYIPKLLFILFNGMGRLFRRWSPPLAQGIFRTAGILSLGLFLILLYSITLGRYNYKVETVEVPIPRLPEAFEGFTIVQLSDIHLGSYGESYQGIRKLVEEVNRLHPDLIVFTGDMVNNFAGEMTYWIPTLKALEAPEGKYAVTGNHDYGDYTRWPDTTAKAENLRDFFKNMQEMGFQMLNNTRVPIVREHDTLWLAGVENWGKPPFPRYGRISQALKDIPPGQSVILLSHDPSHWRAEILDHPVALTLSGHTHAMQLGIQAGKQKWSPAQYLYPEYDGLYREGRQYLHVSRGQGYLGFPGRIGLRPVITEIILKSTSPR